MLVMTLVACDDSLLVAKYQRNTMWLSAVVIKSLTPIAARSGSGAQAYPV
jgi:hypothetical protein